MAHMSLHSRPRFPVALAVATLVLASWVLAAGPTPAHAKGKRSYYFLVAEVKLVDGIPNEIADLVRDRLTRAIAGHTRLIEALPADAPDPKAEPKAFARYIAKRKIRPFRINVEVTQHSHEVSAAPRGGKQLVVSIALRTFGETMPKRVMVFSGEGSATIKMDIGKTLRARDSKVANKDAAELAIADALAISLKRLEARAKGKKGKKGRRAKK